MTSKLQDPLFTQYALNEMSEPEAKRYIEGLIKEGVTREAILDEANAIKASAEVLRKEFAKEPTSQRLSESQRKSLSRKVNPLRSLPVYSTAAACLLLFVVVFSKGIKNKVGGLVEKTFTTVDKNVDNLSSEQPEKCSNEALNYPECTTCKEGFVYMRTSKTCRKK